MASQVLRPWNANYNYSDKERWLCVYPLYLNNKKSLSDGRRVSKNKAIDNPTAAEIRDSLTGSGLNVFYEQDKCHPSEKDPYGKGRVRVQYKNADGILLNPQLTSKNAVLSYICTKIPMLKTRSSHGSQVSSQPSSGAPSSTGGAKKNKKRK